MNSQTLDKIFTPDSIAVIGASDEEGSVGYWLLRNLIGVGYRGVVYPVNPKHMSIQGIQAYPRVEALPRQVDLAIIATPAKTVPDIVEQCGKAGIQAIIIISAGFKETGKEGKALEDQILAIKQKYSMKNFFSNLFLLFNHRAFNTGTWRGISPLERARLRPG